MNVLHTIRRFPFSRKSSGILSGFILSLCFYGCESPHTPHLQTHQPQFHKDNPLSAEPQISPLQTPSGLDKIAKRLEARDRIPIAQAWNPVDEKRFPLDTLENRLKWASKHSVLWEEPVSQLGFGTPLVLGMIWDHQYPGLATTFTQETLSQAQRNRKTLLDYNPGMVFLMEIRWRDAPGSYLPAQSHFWRRDEKGQRILGWDGGPEPYYLLDYDNPNFQERIAQQARSAIDSGIYDGVMLDWSGHLNIIKKVRQSLGHDGLITVNIHDDYDTDGKQFQSFINGAFMECAPDTDRLCTWDKMKKALQFYENEFMQPTVNTLELWGDRDDLRSMRAVTTLGLIHSNASLLFADRNPLPTPDHLHRWYDFWDTDLGKAESTGQNRSDGAYQRRYKNGIVIHNPATNNPIQVHFAHTKYSVSRGYAGKSFAVFPKDGDIFLNNAPSQPIIEKRQEDTTLAQKAMQEKIERSLRRAISASLIDQSLTKINPQYLNLVRQHLFSSINIGEPSGPALKTPSGYYRRDYTKGVVIFNPQDNQAIEVWFDNYYYGVSMQDFRKDFNIPPGDGEIILFDKP